MTGVCIISNFFCILTLPILATKVHLFGVMLTDILYFLGVDAVLVLGLFNVVLFTGGIAIAIASEAGTAT